MKDISKVLTTERYCLHLSDAVKHLIIKQCNDSVMYPQKLLILMMNYFSEELAEPNLSYLATFSHKMAYYPKKCDRIHIKLIHKQYIIIYNYLFSHYCPFPVFRGEPPSVPMFSFWALSGHLPLVETS